MSACVSSHGSSENLITYFNLKDRALLSSRCSVNVWLILWISNTSNIVECYSINHFIILLMNVISQSICSVYFLFLRIPKSL